MLDNDLDVIQLARDSGLFDDIGGLGAESMLRHTAVLDQYHDRAVLLPPYLLSARGYTEAEWRIFVLLKHEGIFYPILYNMTRELLEPQEDFEVLDLIACNSSESRATVNAEEVEHFANYAAQIWCKQEKLSIDDVHKICAMCLVPLGKAEELINLFKNAQQLHYEEYR